MPRKTEIRTFLEGVVKDLERLRNEAQLYGDELSLLAFLIDNALVEAWEHMGGHPPSAGGSAGH